MNLPQVPPNLRQERAGVLAVATELNRLGLIWRETPMVDIGIDGQIELVDESGRAIGRLLAAQVKSGQSYFHDGGDEWRFYSDARHRFYWERFPLPVLLFLHSTEEEATYWVDARQALRSRTESASGVIGIPKRNRLQTTTREELFVHIGASSAPLLPLEYVLTALVTNASPARHFPLSYFDLFANGLTKVTRSLYYGMDLVMEVAEELLRSSDEEQHLGVSASEHEFLFGFVHFLAEQHLADVDISECLIDWYDREMQPRFMAPLTSRGRALVALIGERQNALVKEGRLQLPPGISVAQESFLHVQLRPSHYERIPIIKAFQRLVHPASGSTA